MPNSVDPGPFEDVNQAVIEKWDSETTPYERVRSVVRHTYQPIAADTVAEYASTSSKTARKHLNALASEGFVTTEPGDNGATLYQRSAESLVVEQAADIRSQLSTAELRNQITEMQEQIASFQSTYGVSSPEQLTIEQTNELLRESADSEEQPDAATIREWKTTRRNLAFANAALSIATAEEFVTTDPESGSETSSTP